MVTIDNGIDIDNWQILTMYSTVFDEKNVIFDFTNIWLCH